MLYYSGYTTCWVYFKGNLRVCNIFNIKWICRTSTMDVNMLSPSQLKKYADVLLWGLEIAREEELKLHQSVLLRADLAAMPLVEILYAQILKKGAFPILHLNHPEAIQKTFYTLASDAQLDFVPYGEEELLANVQGLISIRAPRSLTHLQKVKAERLAYAAKSRVNLKNISNQREAEGKFSWCLTVYPTPELAAYANLTPEAYAKQVVKACYLDWKDPVGKWKETHGQVTAVKSWLNGLDIKTLEITGSGCDFSVGLGTKRQWLGISGRNIPSFEIFTSPDFTQTQGQYFANQPSLRDGNVVTDVRLEFKDGKVVKANAKSGVKYLHSQLAADTGASFIGEFSLTDKRFSKISAFMANTLYDENFGGRYGNCHVAIGSSYLNAFTGDAAPLKSADIEALGFNVSSIHWDLINTGAKTVTAVLKDGKRTVIYEDGRFTY